MTASNEPAEPSWPRLRAGDHVALVSPSSFPGVEDVEDLTRLLGGWGLKVKAGEHVLDQRGYMAGHDADRLADLNAAFADPEVRAVIATRGGAGAYRISGGIDFDAVRADPKPLVGFSDITYLHLAIWRHCRVPGIHGCLVGHHAIATARRLLMGAEPSTYRRNPELQPVSAEVPGRARGHLLGGWLGALAGMAGAGLPDLTGAILMIEAERTVGLGQIDRQLTQLLQAGALDGVRGIALGRFPGFEDYTDRGWNLIDVLRDRLTPLGVPVLGGLEFGHGPDPHAVALGTMAELDTEDGTLTLRPPAR
ncbi:LD-carboxypeptidase [Nonomuraea mesophila]|uniref:LD-carboxypeptidase n=1 Tax=Nonomuraea mesophila TaxID=2530382 RepID=A0A4R5EJB3_9ACTN|nr:LD-carboxypeptidase [Nonomuraea mesophila]TDE34477.1 LD-carboxypeptidase [Nonomuraea mesophila]